MNFVRISSIICIISRTLLNVSPTLSRFSHSPSLPPPTEAIGSGWRFDRVAYKHKIFCSKTPHTPAEDVLAFFQIKRPQIYGIDPET